MKKIIILLLLVSVAFSVRGLGVYGDYTPIATDNYVVKVPQELSQPSVFQNSYLVTLMPKISINDASVEFSFTPPAGAFDAAADKYAMEKIETVSDHEIYAKVSIENGIVLTEIRVRNTGSAAAKLSLAYLVKGVGEKDISVFSPENYDNKSANYLVFLQPETNGQALAVLAPTEIKPTFPGVLTGKEYPIFFSVSSIGSGQTFSMQLKFMPFLLKQEGETVYPIDLYSFMSEPLITTSGNMLSNGASGSLDEKITAIISSVDGLSKKSAEFSGVHDVDLSGSEFDSLDSAVYFKQLCIQHEVPCQLVIGKKGEAYYAWVKAYNGNWVDIDAYAGAKQAPNYNIAYVEPKTELHTMPFSDDTLAMVHGGTSWIASIGQMGFLIYFIIIIVVGALGIFMVFFKKVILARLLAKKGVIGKPAAEVEGKYEVLSEEVDDTFLREIIRRIKEKDGIVNMGQLVETMHFSKQLIEEGIRYLVDQKFIKKIM